MGTLSRQLRQHTLPYVDHFSSFLVSGLTSTTLYGILWKSRNARSCEQGTRRALRHGPVQAQRSSSRGRGTLLQNGHVAYWYNTTSLASDSFLSPSRTDVGSGFGAGPAAGASSADACAASSVDAVTATAVVPAARQKVALASATLARRWHSAAVCTARAALVATAAGAAGCRPLASSARGARRCRSRCSIAPRAAHERRAQNTRKLEEEWAQACVLPPSSQPQRLLLFSSAAAREAWLRGEEADGACSGRYTF